MKNKLLKKLILPVLLLCGSFIYAQSVSGTVSDATGPLPGVNVLVKGTTNGTQTDFDGNYTLSNLNSGDVLAFSFIGYAAQEITYTGQATINVTLEEDATTLDEVVVIGYGTTTVKDATGSVSAVTAEDFNRGVIASPEQLIQGKTAGVQISQNSGEPGAGIAIRIRGTNSVRSNNNPLFVIDGVPLAGDDTSGESINVGVGTRAAKNPLAFLNPNDIASISILKDASATAIYGSRGANGVVIITTKSGSKGTGNGVWDFSSSLSISKAAEFYDLLTSKEYLSETARLGLNVAERDFSRSTDWQDVVFRTSASQNQNLSYSRNYGDGNVRATFGYGKQFGVIENSSLERITGRVNAVHRFLDNKLRLNFQGTISRVNDELPPISGSAGFRGDLLGAAYSANPTWPNVADFAGTGGLTSPATLLAYTQSNTNTNRYLINFSTEYDFIEGLTGKVNVGYDYSDADNVSVASSKARNIDQGTFGNGSGGLVQTTVENKLLEVTLNYKKTYENSELDALIGYSFQDFNRRGRTVQGWGFATKDLNDMGDQLESTANTIENMISGSYQQYGYAGNTGGIFVNRLFPAISTDNIGLVPGLKVKSLFADTFDFTDELQSVFARINYTLKNKYLFTATVRADGSSRFGEDNQYGYFPSAAFAWKINEEDFIGESVSTLKLRVGFGITGNQEGLGYGNFVRRTRFGGGDVISDGGDINIPGASPVAFANPDLKWEETIQYSAGIDFGFNNDRFNGSVDAYYKTTNDLLFRVFSAQPAVQPFIFLNLPNSEVVNQGIEVALNYDILQGDDFNWNIGVNAGYNKNEITKLDGQFEAGTIRGQGLSLAFAQKFQEGQPLFSFFLRDFEGFDSTTGQPIQEDIQKFVGKSALPDITSGLSTSASYKNWSLNAYFNAQFGHYIYNNTANAFFTAGAFRGGRNVLPGTLTNGESLDAAADVSTRFLEKGDFVRLQNLSLSYNVPVSGDGWFKSLVLSATGQNLFVITDYTGLDPEVSVSPGGGDLLNGLPVYGIDYTAFPNPRTFTIGLNAKF
ncbi:MAG: SusC/RagA family TonB-linked outer membrane protein [Flavobacteriaceae bacterium]|nr:SusC/RagA family TonB-linked outer membrane protein [Flavobacteriaceae bacterium]